MRPSQTPGGIPSRAAARVAAALAAFMGTLALTVAPAAAESVPAPHIQNYGLDWISRVPAERWPAFTDRPAVCIVDAGVAVTPDSPATDPVNGPIIARLAIDGGGGEPQGTTAEHLHGTALAIQMAGAANGWGMVGVWPQARIISVRATIGGTTGFSSGAYINGAKMCMNWALDNNVKLAAINLSLGSSAGPDSSPEGIRVQDMVVQAHARGISVVASGGNLPGEPTPFPARGDGVLAVAAGTGSPGAFCDYATRDGRTDLVGPACPVAAVYLPTGEEVSYEGGGSSTAAAIASATLGALRTLVPSSTWPQAEGWLSAGLANLSGARIIDGHATGAAAGLGSLVTTVPPAESRTQNPASNGTFSPSGDLADVPPPPLQARKLPKPIRLSASWRRGYLTVTSRLVVRRGRLQITIGSGKHARRANGKRGSGKVSIKASSPPKSVKVRWKAVDEVDGDSSPARLHRPARGWPRR